MINYVLCFHGIERNQEVIKLDTKYNFQYFDTGEILPSSATAPTSTDLWLVLFPTFCSVDHPSLNITFQSENDSLAKTK